jgi:hypothetical protein
MEPSIHVFIRREDGTSKGPDSRIPGSYKMTAGARKELGTQAASIRTRGRHICYIRTTIRLAGDPQIRHRQDIIAKVYNINILKIRVKVTGSTARSEVPDPEHVSAAGIAEPQFRERLPKNEIFIA